MFCPSCGTGYTEGSSFCSKCGNSLVSSIAPIDNDKESNPKSKTNSPDTSPRDLTVAKNSKADLKAFKTNAIGYRPWYKKKRFWILGFVVVFIIASAASGNKGGGGTRGAVVSTQRTTSPSVRSTTTTVTSPTTTVARSTTTVRAVAPVGTALNSYFNRVNRDLSLCVAGIGATQIELASALKPGATTADYVNLYTAARQAEGPCDIAQNTDLLNLGLMNPPAGYSSLSNFSIDLQTWADSDCVKVLKDIEAVANNPQSVADVGSLIADSQTADADGHLLVNQAATAARQASIKNTGGNMILFWSLSLK